MRNSYEWKRKRAIEGIMNYMDNVLGDVSIILCGDFNSYHPDDPFNEGSLGSNPVSIVLNKNGTTNFSSSIHTFIDAYRSKNPLKTRCPIVPMALCLNIKIMSQELTIQELTI